ALHLVPRPHVEEGVSSASSVSITRLSYMRANGDAVLPFTKAPWFPPPPDLPLTDLTYYLLRSSVESPLNGFVCMHASRLQGVLRTLADVAPRLIAEVHDGTVMGR